MTNEEYAAFLEMGMAEGNRVLAMGRRERRRAGYRENRARLEEEMKTLRAKHTAALSNGELDEYVDGDDIGTSTRPMGDVAMTALSALEDESSDDEPDEVEEMLALFRANELLELYRQLDAE